jgi:hypothetical protein
VQQEQRQSQEQHGGVAPGEDRHAEDRGRRQRSGDKQVPDREPGRHRPQLHRRQAGLVDRELEYITQGGQGDEQRAAAQGEPDSPGERRFPREVAQLGQAEHDGDHRDSGAERRPHRPPVTELEDELADHPVFPFAAPLVQGGRRGSERDRRGDQRQRRHDHRQVECQHVEQRGERRHDPGPEDAAGHGIIPSYRSG